MNATQTTAQRVAAHLESLHVYGLAARTGGLSDPDGTDTPGAAWLSSVRDSVTEQLDYMDEITPDALRAEQGGDWCHEAADALIPIYTHPRWQVFTELTAYRIDVSEYTMDDLTDDPADTMTRLAGIALYEAARQLIDALLDDAAEWLEQNPEDGDAAE